MKKKNFFLRGFPSYFDDFIIDGITGITFLEPTQGAEKFLFVSYGFPSSIQLTDDDPVLDEGMSFLKNSFRFFADKYKEEYAFSRPIILICLASHQLKLNLSLRLKEDIHESS